jgi:hypothetical protein
MLTSLPTRLSRPAHLCSVCCCSPTCPPLWRYLVRSIRTPPPRVLRHVLLRIATSRRALHGKQLDWSGCCTHRRTSRKNFLSVSLKLSDPGSESSHSRKCQGAMRSNKRDHITPSSQYIFLHEPAQDVSDSSNPEVGREHTCSNLDTCFQQQSEYGPASATPPAHRASRILKHPAFSLLLPCSCWC